MACIDMTKPLLGLIDDEMWLCNRKAAIEAAIERYMNAGKPIPEKWYEWLKEVNSKLEVHHA